jgi:hypothetical protein
MLDLFADLLLDFVGADEPLGPSSLRAQRRVRCAAVSVAGAMVLGIRIWGGHGTASVTLVVAALLVAVWVLAFSVVDLIKQLPAITQLSLTAALVAGATLAGGALALLQSR